MLNKAHTPPPAEPTKSTIRYSIDGQFNTLLKSAEIACWLGEEVESNIAAGRRMGQFCGTALEDLAGEQAFVVKGMIVELRESWEAFLAAEEVAK